MKQVLPTLSGQDRGVCQITQSGCVKPAPSHHRPTEGGTMLFRLAGKPRQHRHSAPIASLCLQAYNETLFSVDTYFRSSVVTRGPASRMRPASPEFPIAGPADALQRRTGRTGIPMTGRGGLGPPRACPFPGRTPRIPARMAHAVLGYGKDLCPPNLQYDQHDG